LIKDSRWTVGDNGQLIIGQRFSAEVSINEFGNQLIPQIILIELEKTPAK
jgi:hypothetical protein